MTRIIPRSLWDELKRFLTESKLRSARTVVVRKDLELGELLPGKIVYRKECPPKYLQNCPECGRELKAAYLDNGRRWCSHCRCYWTPVQGGPNGLR